MATKSIYLSRNRRLQAAASNSPPLRSGETGEAVELLQQALIDLGFRLPISTKKTGFPDGIYGAETKSAVTAFQAGERLHDDGIAGKDTLHRLDAIICSRELKAHSDFRNNLRSYQGS